jgi:SAM-dependent methyltransferase
MRAEQYDERWETLAASGHDVHGEASLVDSLVGRDGARILDAGCGTGRVAIELARRGHHTVGIDIDAELLARARSKAPVLDWVEADLAALPVEVAPGPYDAVVLAGNVMIYVARGTAGAVVAHLAARLAPRGLLIAGFQLAGQLPLAEYDEHAHAAGLTLATRWSTWERAPFAGAEDYAVSVHTLVLNR